MRADACPPPGSAMAPPCGRCCVPGIGSSDVRVPRRPPPRAPATGPQPAIPQLHFWCWWSGHWACIAFKYTPRRRVLYILGSMYICDRYRQRGERRRAPAPAARRTTSCSSAVGRQLAAVAAVGCRCRLSAAGTHSLCRHSGARRGTRTFLHRHSHMLWWFACIARGGHQHAHSALLHAVAVGCCSSSLGHVGNGIRTTGRAVPLAVIHPRCTHHTGSHRLLRHQGVPLRTAP